MSFLFPSSTITFDAALRDLASGSPRARALAAHALGDVTDPGERRRAVDALILALEDERPEVRAEACSSLGDLREPCAIPRIVRRLDDGSPPVRQSAAIALGSIGHPDGFEPLATALREGPADLRFQAATSLAEIDPKRAFDPIAAALSDKDSQVVGAAALSLGAIPAIVGDVALRMRARTALLELLEHSNEGTRFDVAYALAELGERVGPFAELDDAADRGAVKAIQQVLVRALADVDRAWDAVTALTKLGPAHVDELHKALTDRQVPPEATVLAAGAILRLGATSDAARRVLLAGLAARKTHVRGLAVEQLGEVGSDWAVAPLEKLARSGKGGELLEAIAVALRAIAARSKPS